MIIVCLLNFRFRICLCENNAYLCRYKFEANHNKDYSVVKTLKAGLSGFAFLCDALKRVPFTLCADGFSWA